MTSFHTLAIFAILGLASVIDPAYAQPFGRGPIRPEVRALLKKADAKKITVAQPGRPQEQEKTYDLAKDVEIALDNSPRRGVYVEGKPADLTEGSVVSLQLSADQKTVESIIVEGPQMRGILKSVEPAKNTLTIRLATPGRGDDAPEEKTLTLAAGAEIVVDDGLSRRFSLREGSLADLHAGGVATLRLTVDQTKVLSVQSEGMTVVGKLKAAEAGKRRVTVTLNPQRPDEQGEEKTFDVHKEALIVVDDGKGRRLSVKETKLDALPQGSFLTLRLSPDQSTAATVRAEGPSIPGMVKGVDADKGTITIATFAGGRDNPQEKTYTLAKDVRVTIGGTESKLADIKVADNGPFAMLRLTLDQKEVQAIAASLGR